MEETTMFSHPADGMFLQDGDWDLVNMQRLSKAVEDTGKSDKNDSTKASMETPAASDADAAAAAAAAEVDAAETAESSAVTGTAAATAGPSAAEGDAGFEESKSSDEGGESADADTREPNHQQQQQVPVQRPPSVASVPQVPPNMATKWHRELCSLAEMGFENTPRNVILLEKHVVESGKPGMER